jgi:hypothetical protein
MSLAQWRQFNFFDKQQATDPIEKGKTPAIFQVSNLKKKIHPCFNDLFIYNNKIEAGYISFCHWSWSYSTV